MAQTKRPSFMKRQKEQARQEKARGKQDRRDQRKVERTHKPENDDEVDPDIAHIVPGPQPVPWEQDDE